MKTRKPLTNEEGEVRELLMEDIRRFRPIAEGISPSLAAKLGMPPKSTGKSVTGSKKGEGMGKLEAIYRALLDLPRAGDQEVAKLADQYAGNTVSAGVVGNRRGEVRWMLRELERRGWLTAQAAQEVKPLVEN